MLVYVLVGWAAQCIPRLTSHTTKTGTQCNGADPAAYADVCHEAPQLELELELCNCAIMIVYRTSELQCRSNNIYLHIQRPSLISNPPVALSIP